MKTAVGHQDESFYCELGSGLTDIFLSVAFCSGSFRVPERTELDRGFEEQNLAVLGRVGPATAAELGRCTGAKFSALGSLSEFSVDTASGSGGVLGAFGGAQTVTARSPWTSTCIGAIDDAASTCCSRAESAPNRSFIKRARAFTSVRPGR